MYQIDNSTAVATQPPSTPAGNAGFFTDGNAALGSPPTIFPAEFANMLMLEIINAVKAAGITPDKTKFNQLAQAIGAGGGNYGVDSGAANAYVVTLANAPTALADGLVVAFKVKNANTGASTLNVNGLGAQPLVGQNGLALTGGELAANGIVSVRWNSSSNAWVIGAGQFGVSTPQFDRSSKLASTAFCQSIGMQYSTLINLTASRTMLPGDINGLVFAYNAGLTYTLPTPISLVPGYVGGAFNGFTVTVSAAGNPITIQAGSGVTLLLENGNAVSSIVVAAGSTVQLQAGAQNSWRAVGGSGALPGSGLFAASLGGTGYQKLPSGVILQWGAVNLSASGPAAVTFPIAFPNAAPYAGLQIGSNGAYFAIVTGGSLTRTGFTGDGYTTAGARVGVGALWFAIGY